MSPDGGGKNSEDRIPWTLTDNISANPQTQLIEFAIPLFDLFTLKVQQVGFRFAKAARFLEQIELFYDLLWLQQLK